MRWCVRIARLTNNNFCLAFSSYVHQRAAGSDADEADEDFDHETADLEPDECPDSSSESDEDIVDDAKADLPLFDGCSVTDVLFSMIIMDWKVPRTASVSGLSSC